MLINARPAKSKVQQSADRHQQMLQVRDRVGPSQASITLRSQMTDSLGPSQRQSRTEMLASNTSILRG